MPSLIDRYVRTGKVKVVARVLDFIGPDSSRGRNAMIAAGAQDKAFDFAQVLYDNQGKENTGWLSDAMVAQAAKSIPGLDPRRLFAQRDSATVKAAAAAFDRDAVRDGVKGTPTLFVGKSGTPGKQVALRSPTDESSIVAAIDAALA
jgi:protein-disulfide isomerase